MLLNKNINIIEKTNIDKAIELLKKVELDKAKEYVHLAMIEDDNNGNAQNLLGIYYELIGNLDLARRHYRAALALDPTLDCASNNLLRICEFKNICSSEYVDFGQKAA